METSDIHPSAMTHNAYVARFGDALGAWCATCHAPVGPPRTSTYVASYDAGEHIAEES
jgi:hypothetical protein